MDEDLRDALFGEDGDFEQLDDDFVTSVCDDIFLFYFCLAYDNTILKLGNVRTSNTRF